MVEIIRKKKVKIGNQKLKSNRIKCVQNVVTKSIYVDRLLLFGARLQLFIKKDNRKMFLLPTMVGVCVEYKRAQNNSFSLNHIQLKV